MCCFQNEPGRTHVGGLTTGYSPPDPGSRGVDDLHDEEVREEPGPRCMKDIILVWVLEGRGMADFSNAPPHSPSIAWYAPHVLFTCFYSHSIAFLFGYALVCLWQI